MSSSLAEQRGQQRRFLEQLLDTSKLENYTVPIPIKADLRKYQQVRYGKEASSIPSSIPSFIQLHTHQYIQRIHTGAWYVNGRSSMH